MAENKKSFLLYCDLIHTVEKLPNEKAGELFKHILMYVNDQNPTTNDLIIDLTFEPIKQQLKRDLKRYEATINNKSLNGRLGNLKRWNNDLYNKVVDNQLDIEEAENIAKHRKTSLSDFSDSQTSQSVAKVADKDNVNVNDNVNVINNNIKPKQSFDERTQKFKDELIQFKDKYGVEMLKSFFNYWSEPNQSKTKMRFELQKTWDTSKRLATWSKNESNFNNSKPKTLGI